MKRVPDALDAIADVVLAYRPADKKKRIAKKAKAVARVIQATHTEVIKNQEDIEKRASEIREEIKRGVRPAGKKFRL